MPDPAPAVAPNPAAPPENPTKAARRAAARRMFLRLCGTALGAGIALPTDAALIEPYALETTRHEVFLPDLPPDLDGLTVAHLTDLHRGHITPDAVIESAVKVTAALNPDVVCLTGDYVAWNPADAAALGRMLAPLNPRLGVWATLGNHDYLYGGGPVADALTKESGGRIRLLRNAGAELAPGLWVCGIEDTWKGNPDSTRATAAVPDDAAAIFLTHNPIGVWHITKRPWLALSGHTHGGQILIPGFPTPRPPGMEGFPMSAGWGVFDRARLYISRGVGMGGAPLRFRCRPEVAIHVLRRGDAPPRTAPTLTGRALRKAVRLAKRAARSIG